MAIRGIAGFEANTSCYMDALVNPPFYENGEGNAAFQYPPHADYFTVGYWVDNDDKWSTQTFARPYPSGNFQWEGYIEVGANDVRATQTFDWWIDNYASDLHWMVQIYRCDTRSLVNRTFVYPRTAPNYGAIDVSTSRTGYDLLVAAWSVPEPGSLIALLSGLVGLGGLIMRRR